MYIDPRDLARRQRQFSLAPQWSGISPSVGMDMTTGPTASEPAEQLDLDRYPTWAHSLMAQVFPNLDGTGRLSTPLVLEEAPGLDTAIPIKQAHPECRKPNPMSAECAEDWRAGELYCAGLQARGKLPDTGRGFGRGLHECVCGQVAAACGGNPTTASPPWNRPPPPKTGKRR